MECKRVTIIVLDSAGVGHGPDAADYGDAGSNTIGHIAQAVGGLHLPHMGALGLGNIIDVAGTPPMEHPQGAWGKMQEASRGKDTMVGHWELAGLVTHEPLSVWPDGFPPEIVSELEKISGRGILANRPASGTAIIEELGEEHMDTGKLIVYTSADSVLQIAAHEDVVPLEELYRICEQTRILADKHRIGRVIARPFVGKPGAFERTYNRKDYPMEPPGQTILDKAREAGIHVIGVGKIHDIFAGRGIAESFHTEGNADGIARTRELLERRPTTKELLFVNLVDFDMLYGHRNDPEGYARALAEFDQALPSLLEAAGPDEILLITADHGNDPTYPGTDHTRECVPILAWGSGDLTGLTQDKALGTRETFADVAATTASLLGLAPWPVGTPFFEIMS